MATPTASIVRRATRDPNKPLNIISFPTHERYQSSLDRTSHRFYLWHSQDNSIKTWDTTYAPVPPNTSLLNASHSDNQIPSWLEPDIDLVLSQNKFGQFAVAHKIARRLGVPLISLEHTLPVPSWGVARLRALKNMRGDVNVFISEYSRQAWGWGEDETEVVHHGIDTALFSPMENIEKKKHILSVVNKWPERDWCCGFKLWQNITKDLLVFPVGDSPGLSRPAKDVNELVRFYNEAQVFVNTSLVSPIPTALMESMACGGAVVSTATCMIPEVIENGVNGYISNNPNELRSYLIKLLNDPEECRRIGQNARKTILEKFSLDNFVKNWNNIFRKSLEL